VNYFKKLLVIFLLAFVLNFVWEFFHSNLYIHYQNKSITQLVLLRASLFDAFFVIIAGLLVIKFKFPKNWGIYVFGAGIVFAIFLEGYALSTGRWLYKDSMPIIPLLGTGLTPTVQLGLLSYLVLKLVFKTNER